MTEKQLEHDMLMQFILEDCYVNTKQSIEYPPVALSLGEKIIKLSKLPCSFLYK